MNHYTYLIQILKEIKDILTKKEELLQVEELLNKSIIVLQKQRSIIGIRLEDSVIWESRIEYFKIINKFVNNQIDGEDFCQQIGNLEIQNMSEVKKLAENLNYTTDFSFTSKSINFSSLMNRLDSLIDLFEPGLPDSESSDFALSENEFRSKVQNIILPKFLNYYNID